MKFLKIKKTFGINMTEETGQDLSNVELRINLELGRFFVNILRINLSKKDVQNLKNSLEFLETQNWIREIDAKDLKISAAPYKNPHLH